MASYKNILGDYVISSLSVDDSITVATPELDLVANTTVTGNLTADYFYGDGQFLTNVVANVSAASKLQNGTSNVDIPVINGNITFAVNGTSNLVVMSQAGLALAQTTVSVDQYTGALTVAGGVGIVGNVYAGGMFDNGQPVLNAISVINGGTY